MTARLSSREPGQNGCQVKQSGTGTGWLPGQAVGNRERMTARSTRKKLGQDSRLAVSMTNWRMNGVSGCGTSRR